MSSPSAADGRPDDPRALRAAWFVLAAALVAVHVVYPAARPIHGDTMMTGGKVLLPWRELLEDTRRNAFEPAFYFVMKAWCGVAGVSLRALLAPAGVCAVAAPCVLAWAIRPWVPDARTRLLAAVLTGLHPAAVLFGSGLAKQYAPLALLAAFAAGAWIRAVEIELSRAPDDAARARCATRWLVAFSATALAASQLHFPGILLPLIAAVHGAVAARRDARLRRAAVWAVATLAVAAALAVVWRQRIETRLIDGRGMHWVDQARGGSLARAIPTDVQTFVWGVPLPNLAAGPAIARIGAVLALAAAAVGLPWLAATGTRSAGSRAALLVSALVVPFVAVALTDLVRPMYYARYVSVAILPAGVLAALAVESLVRSGRRRSAGALATLLVAGRAAGFVLLGFATVGESPGLRRLAALDRARTERATLVVLPEGRWRERWILWIEAVHGPVPPGITIARAGDPYTDGTFPDVATADVATADGAATWEPLANVLRGHRRVVIATAAPAEVGALRGALDGWSVESSSCAAEFYDAATGRRRPSLPLTVLVRDAIR